MPPVVSIGNQDFASIRESNSFYVDKTAFIKEWWENNDSVTLITRPRRFGKTLNMSMLDQFFSNRYADRGRLFEGLSIWKEEKYRELQGTYPVISLSFASVKGVTYHSARDGIIRAIFGAFRDHDYLLTGNTLSGEEKENFRAIGKYVLNPSPDRSISDDLVTGSLHELTFYLYRHFGKKAFILLDEYDTPLQEAYVNGFWKELVALIRSLFNAAFKTNPCLERAVLTGITRVSKESIFSDLNNLKVVTTTSPKYCTQFGFTEEEVFHALDHFGMSEQRENVKKWYDGFTFGNSTDIYNPWSITSYLDEKKLKTYWANTSSNSLAGKLIREGKPDIKIAMEDLLDGKQLETAIDEEIVFDQLEQSESAVWSLLLASGYLRVDGVPEDGEDQPYLLSLTNLEVKKMFQKMIRSGRHLLQTR